MLSMAFIAALNYSASTQAEMKNGASKVHHLVVVWLKQHGDENARRQYINASKQLAKLPGVVDYHIGTPTTIKREHPSPALDNSYDIAISSTFENAQALENYSKHPEHQKIIHEVLKPLVDKYQVYDFAE
jgi:quinol monooxygenase YgiN